MGTVVVILVYGRGKDGDGRSNLNWLLASVRGRQDGIWRFWVNAKLVANSENSGAFPHTQGILERGQGWREADQSRLLKIRRPRPESLSCR